MSRILKLGFVLLVMAAGLVFHIRNDHPVEFDFYLGIISMPFSIYVIGALCIGALLGVVSLMPRLFRLKRENARLQRHLKVNETELNNLRAIPIRDNR